MTYPNESPEITALNREALDALRTMLADKQRTDTRARVRPTTPSAWRRATRFRPMGA